MAQLNESNLVVFTKHLGVMIKAGIPLSEALNSLEEDSTSLQQKKLIGSLRAQVEAGKSLTLALSTYPKVFDRVYLSLVTIGEESGTLDSTLKFLSDQLGKLQNLRKKIQSSLMYPALVLGLMFAVGIGLSLFVLPKLVDFFAAFDQVLPLPTRILLSFANLMKYHGITIIVSFLAFVLLFNLVIKIPPVKRKWDRFIFKLPFLGNFLRLSRMAELSRNMSVLLTSGVPLVSGLKTLIDSQPNLYISESLKILQLELGKGKSLGDTITSKHLTVFPNLFNKMVSVGEKTGKLDEMLMYMADYYEEEIENASKNLTTVLEPILLIIVGIMVGFMAIAIIGPIYQITGSIGG